MPLLRVCAYSRQGLHGRRVQPIQRLVTILAVATFVAQLGPSAALAAGVQPTPSTPEVDGGAPLDAGPADAGAPSSAVASSGPAPAPAADAGLSDAGGLTDTPLPLAGADGGVLDAGAGVTVLQTQVDQLPAAGTLRITVDGVPLVGARSFAERRGTLLVVPLIEIATRVGAIATVDPAARTVSVRRASGVTGAWDANTGQVTEDGAPILVASRSAAVEFGAGAGDLMVPSEILSALLDVAVVVNAAESEVQINTPRGPVAMVDRARTPFDLYRADYGYHLGLLNQTLNHSLQLNAAGRALDGVFDVATSFTRYPTDRFVQFRNGRATYETAYGFRFLVGDFNPGAELQFLSAQIRGASVNAPVGEGRLELFAGASRSDVVHLNAAGQPSLAYDTTIVGTDYTRVRQSSLAANNAAGGHFRLLTNLGAMYFTSPDREGGVLATRVGYGSEKNQAQIDAGLGAYRGLQANGQQVSGVAPFIDASDAYTPTRRLTLLGRASHIGGSFISPQQTGSLRPMNLLAAGANWLPLDWISSSLNGQLQFTPDFSQRTDASITGTVSLTPGEPWPNALASHSQGFHPGIGATSFTFIDLNKQFAHWALDAIYSRTQSSLSPANHLFSLGARIDLSDDHRLQLLQSVTSAGAVSGSADVFAARVFTDRVSASLGAGYSYYGGAFNLMGRLGANAALPWNQVLTVSFAVSAIGPQLLIDLRGPLWSSPRGSGTARTAEGRLEGSGALTGRVYQDIDGDGRFNPQVDRPQPEVHVLVDGSYFAVSDEQGAFSIRDLKAGQHQVLLDLLTVRADLTILGEPQMAITLPPGREAQIEYRLVRTGRIRGAVFVDVNGDGHRDPGDTPVADVRVVTGSGKDTLTDLGGDFVIGDLPAGRHAVLLDEKTLGEGYEAASAPQHIEVRPGEEVGGIELLVKVREKPVEILEFPPAVK